MLTETLCVNDTPRIRPVGRRAFLESLCGVVAASVLNVSEAEEKPTTESRTERPKTVSEICRENPEMIIVCLNHDEPSFREVASEELVEFLKKCKREGKPVPDFILKANTRSSPVEVRMRIERALKLRDLPPPTIDETSSDDPGCFMDAVVRIGKDVQQEWGKFAALIATIIPK